MKEKILAFWSINDALNLEKAIQDIDLFIDSGLDGVVFQPRNYPGPPAYLSQEYYLIVSQLIIYCKEQQIEFWLYDENGWPSGTADGKLMAVNPNLRKEWLELADFSEGRSDQGVPLSERFAYHSEAQPSAICRKATELFIEIVYEGYRKGLTEEAFDYITGFFSDETALPINKTRPSVPWSDELAQNYQAQTDRKLIEDLPALFFDDHFTKKRTEKIRYTYWELCSSLLGQNYYQPLTTWCQKYNKRFTAHLRGEENIALSIPFSGSAFQVLKFVDLPMIDALERKRTNQFYPRIASSLAAQFSDGNTFCEAMGGSGWGVEPKDVVQYYEWLADCNVNISCLHQSHLRLNAQALKDWPPSIPKHLTWQPLFSEVLKEVRQIYQKKKKVQPVLAIVPVRKVMGKYQAWELSQTNRHKGEVQPATAATALSNETNSWVADIADHTPNLHLIDEKLFEETAVFHTDYLQVGNQQYHQVVAHEDCLFLDKKFAEGLKGYRFTFEKDEKAERSTEPRGTNLINHQENWQLQPTNENRLPFGENYFQAGLLKKDIQIRNWNGLSLVTSDLIDSFSVNGSQINVQPFIFGEHFLYTIPAYSLKKGNNRFEIKASQAEPQPMCWLKGDFYVGVEEKKKGKNCVIALQPFIDRVKTVENFEQLSDEGYPFIGAPLIVSKKIFLDQTVEAGWLNFSYFKAAGGEIVLDGKIVINYWSERAAQKLPVLSAGEHTVKVTLYPSTFNAYGPYRYMGGDSPVVSPLQYQDKKNLMDPSVLPENIQHYGLNYKNTGIGELRIFV